MPVHSTFKHQLIGEMLLVADGDHLIYSTYTDSTSAKEKKAGSKRDDKHPVLRAAAKQLEEYLEGKQRRLEIPLRLTGSEFQQRVYRLVQNVPLGHTTSYLELAAKLNKPGAARSIGAAIGKNPLLIFVPDHRVISHSGKIGGFSGTWNRKPGLIKLEEQLAKGRF